GGARDAGDYSANKTAYSYVTKMMLDAAIPPAYTFENGLREDSGVVKLGLDLTTVGTTNEGLLTESTYLVYGDILNDFSLLQFQTGLDSNPSVLLSAKNSLHQFSIGIDGEKLAIEKGDIST